MTRAELEARRRLCHPSCRRSVNVSPLAPCRCRCGGYAHASETLAEMTPIQRARAAREATNDLRHARECSEARVAIALVNREAERVTRRLAGGNSR